MGGSVWARGVGGVGKASLNLTKITELSALGQPGRRVWMGVGVGAWGH